MKLFSSKYGVARHIYVPLIKRGVVDYAVGADWTPAASDVKISKDGGAAANTANLPVAIAMGNTAIWDFSLTAAEMQAAQIIVTVADSATKAIEDDAFVIESFGDGLGQMDLREIADAHLKRDMGLVTGEAQRSPLNALRILRNRVNSNTGKVYKEDDVTEAWTFTKSTAAGGAVIFEIDPA